VPICNDHLPNEAGCETSMDVDDLDAELIT
jgi:hypothetical protein